MKRIILTGVAAIMVATSGMVAQDQLRKADKQFELKVYDQALDSYQRLYNKDQANDLLRSKIAACYAATNHHVVAAEWYSQIEDLEVMENVAIEYGHILKRLGKYDHAKSIYSLALTADRETAEYFTTSCDYAEMLLSDQYTEVYPASFNTRDSDFGLSFYKGTPIFCSFNDHLSFINPVIKEKGNRLYSADPSELLAVNRAYNLRPAMKANYGLGPISYQGDDCAYTHNFIAPGTRHFAADDSDASIYLAETSIGGDFAKETAFPYNSTSYATAHPCLVDGGETMYFASNRPGGYGGYDLYVSTKVNGEWSLPTNLGATINTAGNEVTPVVYGDRVIFASDYHLGLGGFDLFVAAILGEGYGSAENMGNGINSPADDYYPAVAEATDRLYFSSNRLGGRGHEDIYVSEKLGLTQEAPPVFVINQEVPSTSTPDNVVAVADREVIVRTEVAAPVEHVTLNYSIDDVLAQQRDVAIVPTADEVAAPVVAQAQVAPVALQAARDNVQNVEVVTRAAKGIPVEPRLVAPRAYRIPDLSLRSKPMGSDEIVAVADVDVARRVWAGSELPPAASVYFVQLAAFNKRTANLKAFEALVQYGNIYKVYANTATKVRLGYFTTEEEARSALRHVKADGYRDAFITFQPLDINKMELVYSSYDYDVATTKSSAGTGDLSNTGNTNAYEPSSYMVRKKWNGTSRYKVRLASYEDPKSFELKRADELGRVEQWTKGGWTIFLTSGYSGIEEAEAACRQAINKGFRDAEVVLDNDGILERLKKN